MNPESYAVTYSDCSWSPCLPEEKPIPDCLLMESAECDECPDVDLEESLGLARLLDVALRRSPLTRETWAHARLAAARYGITQSPFYPDINFDAFWEAVRNPAFFGGNLILIDEYREYGPYLTMSYLMWDFGTTRAVSRAFYQQLIEANWNHNREIQTVIQTVTNDYYDLIAQKEKVIAGEANLNDATTTLRATEAKHTAGITDITDVYTAETMVAKEVMQLLADEQSEANAKAALLADAGLPANACIAIDNLSDYIDEEEFLQTVDHYICLAYDLRPDLRSAYAKVLSDESFVKAAERHQLPTVTFDGHIGQSHFSGGFSDHYDYSAKFSLNYPIFKGWRYTNEIREAQALLELSKAKLRDVEVQMVKDVVTSYNDFQYATAIVVANKEYVDLAQKTFAANLSEYKSGTIDITTLVQSQTSLADARYSLAEARKNWYNALTNLTYATGVVTKPCCPGGL